MKKNVTFALISVSLASVVFAGCSGKDPVADPTASAPTDNFHATGFPIVEKPITLDIFNRQSNSNIPWDKMLVFREYEKMTNIKASFKNVPTAGFNEKRNLILNTKDLPDIFISANFTRLDAVKYGTSGMFIPLEGLIDQYAPNIKALFDQYPEIKQSLTAPDGHIYMLSDFVTLFSARTAKPWLNKKWLDELGLEVPKTTQELKNVLIAFRDQDPNRNGQKDEIPMSGENLGQIVSNINGAWGLENQMGNRINVQDDKVRYWPADDRYKQILQYLHELYKEKLLDNTLFTQQDTEYLTKTSEAKVGFFYKQATDTFSAVADQFIGIEPVAGPNGDRLHTQVQPIARSYGAFAITSANPYPAESIRWIDYFSGEEGSIFLRYGVEGQTFNYADGVPTYPDEVLKNEKGSAFAISQFAPWPGTAITHWINDKNSNAVNPPQVQEAAEKLEPYIPERILGAPLFDAATAKKVDTLLTDVNTYIDESSAKFVNGERSFDDWDNYVSTLNKMGLAEIEEIYQEAYDTTYKN
ncbi:type 2 periplasmic-binding domain-containing protein [Paenibacillus arenilitoris]|uniref:Extracellular solute-binding protein n=1 Tax=Paenibacillus arenilitoris TaxID=2772299 RepID=A0A927CFM0_9BACL|nr:extracellular solute-binding protein [Paenibacillus arenilitoris]MBD2867194.1 extracellular solute-binding protein [Paenibacillus arenilitoris]